MIGSVLFLNLFFIYIFYFTICDFIIFFSFLLMIKFYDLMHLPVFLNEILPFIFPVHIITRL